MQSDVAQDDLFTHLRGADVLVHLAWLFDAVLRLPIMDVSRARRELGWSPRHSAVQAIQAFLDGLRAGEGKDTPPLTPDASGPLRLREFLTGIGRRP